MKAKYLMIGLFVCLCIPQCGEIDTTNYDQDVAITEIQLSLPPVPAFMGTLYTGRTTVITAAILPIHSSEELFWYWSDNITLTPVEGTGGLRASVRGMTDGTAEVYVTNASGSLRSNTLSFPVETFFSPNYAGEVAGMYYGAGSVNGISITDVVITLNRINDNTVEAIVVGDVSDNPYLSGVQTITGELTVSGSHGLSGTMNLPGVGDLAVTGSVNLETNIVTLNASGNYMGLLPLNFSYEGENYVGNVVGEYSGSVVWAMGVIQNVTFFVTRDPFAEMKIVVESDAFTIDLSILGQGIHSVVLDASLTMSLPDETGEYALEGTGKSTLGNANAVTGTFDGSALVIAWNFGSSGIFTFTGTLDE